MDFNGKKIFVTGGCGGLGLAISKAFINSGATVIAGDINENFRVAAKKSVGSDRFHILNIDISKEDLVQQAFATIKREHGPLDAVVNNAGILDRLECAGEVAVSLWQKVIDVNLTGTFLVTKYAIENMLDGAEKTENRSIINVASVSGLSGSNAGVAYTASKHGILGITKSTASHYALRGIRCNAIMPGSMAVDGQMTNIGSSMAQGHSAEGMKLVMQKMQSNRGDVEVAEVASSVLFLASDLSKFVNGACIPIDNGWSCA